MNSPVKSDSSDLPMPTVGGGDAERISLPENQLTTEQHLARYQRGLSSEFFLHSIFLCMALLVMVLSFAMRSEGPESVYLPFQKLPMPES